MPTIMEDKQLAQRRGTVFHPISPEDKTAMAAMRAIVEPNKGRLQGTAARVPFDAIMERVAVPEGVTFEAGAAGGIPGWWCRPLFSRRKGFPSAARWTVTPASCWRAWTRWA